MNKIISQIYSLGINPLDDADARLQKSLLVLCTIIFIVAGIGWGMFYVFLGEVLAGIIPLAYAALSLTSLAYFGLTRSYNVFCFIQLLLILILPFFVMLALGGFVGGSAVILWSLICPLGALLFNEPRYARGWFLAFICLVILSGLFQPYLRSDNHLSFVVINMFFVFNFIAVSSIAFLLVSYFVEQKSRFQEKAEALILNILPKDIATVLKDDQHVIANHYHGASILFADMVNFTKMSAEMNPDEIINLLNTIFSHFDSLVEKYGLEKIKTIGDCYMVASGVPRPRPDHAVAIVNLALDIQDFIRDQTFAGGRQIAFRIGINSGPVVAGVIGHKKFIYDLWGDAVNTASRMESHGQSGTIQISRSTYELVKDSFVCEPHGIIKLKGKGEMEVWFVTGRKPN